MIVKLWRNRPRSPIRKILSSERRSTFFKEDSKYVIRLRRKKNDLFHSEDSDGVFRSYEKREGYYLDVEVHQRGDKVLIIGEKIYPDDARCEQECDTCETVTHVELIVCSGCKRSKHICGECRVRSCGATCSYCVNSSQTVVRVDGSILII